MENKFYSPSCMMFETSEEPDGISDASLPGRDVTARLMRVWCILTAQVPYSDAIM